MDYPMLEDVVGADMVQLARWHRYLKSPGVSAIGKADFAAVTEREMAVMEAIQAKLKKGGGITPEISKQIGWME